MAKRGRPEVDRPAAAPRGPMQPEMPLGDFLVSYLERIGVTDIFGLPGDLVLGLFQRFGADRNLRIITLSHEPAIGFAADGYARSTRRLGVAVVTYGAGGHNVVNPIAGAYAEQVPLLVVSGGPGEAESKVAAVHHQVKDVESQCRVFREVTVEARVLRYPERAAREIHELVSRVQSEHLPGYLEIHRDLVTLPIPVPEEIRDWDGRFEPPRSDPKRLREAVQETAERVRRAKRPIVLAGVELFREKADRPLRTLVEKLGVPVVTSVLAKGVFPMDHPQHMGIYQGPFSPPSIERRVREADFVLSLGTVRTDINLGAAPSQIRPEQRVWARDGLVDVSYHTYRDVQVGDFVRSLARQELPSFDEKIRYADNLHAARKATEPLDVHDLLVGVNDFLAEHPDLHVIAESGDMLFGGLEIRLHGPGLYFAQGYYASMGFAIPAALGAEIGTRRRPLVLCGDGGFQMTGMEISHAPRLGLAPIVVIVNNAGWGIFRPVTPRADLLDLPVWPYAELANGLGGRGYKVTTRAELASALREAQGRDEFAIIEAIVPRDSLSPVSRRYIEESARRAGAQDV